MKKIEKIFQFIKNQRLTNTAFEQKSGLSNGYLRNIEKTNSEISGKMLNKMFIAYPELENYLESESPAGLKTNTKEVIPLGKHTPLRLTADQYSEAFGDWQGLPIYNKPITASFINTYNDDKINQPMYYLHDPRFRDCQFGAIITGDSMHSEIRHGDIAMCREIEDKSFIVYGDIYYIVAKNGLETCKYINAGKDENSLLLVPRNENISPSPIKKSMISKLYKVRGIIRGY